MSNPGITEESLKSDDMAIFSLLLIFFFSSCAR